MRAQQSAGILAEVLSIPDIHIINELREVDPLSAEGKSYDELEERGGIYIIILLVKIRKA